MPSSYRTCASSPSRCRPGSSSTDFTSPRKDRERWRRRYAGRRPHRCPERDAPVIFTELRFVLLVVISWVCFFAVPRRFRSVVLTASGIVFYAMYAGRYIPLVLALVVGVNVLSQPRWAWIAVAG